MPLATLDSDGSQLSSESEVLVVVGTCRVSSGIYEVTEILDTQPSFARPRRNRFAPTMMLWGPAHSAEAEKPHRLNGMRSGRQRLCAGWKWGPPMQPGCVAPGDAPFQRDIASVVFALSKNRPASLPVLAPLSIHNRGCDRPAGAPMGPCGPCLPIRRDMA